MKKTRSRLLWSVLIVCVAAVALFCFRTDDGPEVSVQDIVGTWYVADPGGYHGKATSTSSVLTFEALRTFKASGFPVEIKRGSEYWVEAEALSGSWTILRVRETEASTFSYVCIHAEKRGLQFRVLNHAQGLTLEHILDPDLPPILLRKKP